MKLAHARSLIPAGRIELARHHPERDHTALNALARWAIRFSPSVEPDQPDGLWIDVTGCKRLYHGEDRLARLVHEALTEKQLNARVAIACTKGCAWAVARYGRLECTIVQAGREVEALSPLPIDGLRIDPGIELTLRQMNVHRIGEVLKLPRRELAARFGASFVRRIDQSTGVQPEGISAIRPFTPPREEVIFSGAITQLEAVELAAQELIEKVSHGLEQLESGARELLLTLFRIDAAPTRVRLSLTAPSRSASHLWKLLRPRLERVNLGYGIESMTLTTPRVAVLPHTQTESDRLGGGVATDQARTEGELIDTLVNRLGEDGVLEMKACETHIPENIFRMCPATTEQAAPAPALTSCCRPTFLRAPPEPAEVLCLTPDGPVVAVRCRGDSVKVRASLGPERIAPQWWESTRNLPARDYFRVETESGRWLWLMRTGAAWFVHGEWL